MHTSRALREVYCCALKTHKSRCRKRNNMYRYSLKIVLNFPNTAFLYEYKRLFLDNVHN